MSAKPKRIFLSSEGQPRSPARQALADAIAARDEAKQRVDEAGLAVARLSNLVSEAEASCMQANAVAKAQRDLYAERIAESAKSGSPLLTETATVRKARDDELSAQDALAAAQQAGGIAEAALGAAQAMLKQAEAGVMEAADDVIRAVDADAMLAEMEVVQNRLIALRLQHRYFRRSGLYMDKEAEKRGERLLHWEFPPPYGAVEWQTFDVHPRYRDWMESRIQLLHDPDAPLPGEPGHVALLLGPDPDEARAEADARDMAWALRMIQSRDAAEAE